MAARHPAPRRLRPIRRRTGLLRRSALLLRGLAAVIALTTLLVGIPWGLMNYIGWPLPGHIPTWSDARATLLAPMSVHFLLNALASILWPVWGLFALDLVRAAAAEVRAGSRSAPPHTGPLQAAATVLVGAIVVSLLSMRPMAPPLMRHSLCCGARGPASHRSTERTCSGSHDSQRVRRRCGRTWTAAPDRDCGGTPPT